MESNQFCILWNNYHNSLVHTIEDLRKEEQLVDVTIVCSDGGQVLAHQLVLAACSSFFRDFIRDHPSKHPIVLLPTEFQLPELKAMVQFMYTGQVCVPQDQLKAFIKGARYLRIKGLEDSEEESDVEEINTEGGAKSCLEPEEINYTKSSGHKGQKPKDHRYSQEVDVGESDEPQDKWPLIDRKPIILPTKHADSGGRKRRRKLTSIRKRPMHLSNNIVCYEKGRKDYLSGYDKEPINKIRRLGSPGRLHDDDLDICTCTSRKIWSVKDTEGLLEAWKETLLEVPPSYFIRSMSLCRSVSTRLQRKGIRKNWRQCQVKMKNLRREVRLFKEAEGKNIARKSSEVANACEKLMPYIEDIFNKEEEIRQDWYRMKEGKDDERIHVSHPRTEDILAQVSVLADSDICDDDTDANAMETENEGGGYVDEDPTQDGVQVFTENEDAFVTHLHTPHYTMHTGPDGTVHHIVEDVSLHITKDEPASASEL